MFKTAISFFFVASIYSSNSFSDTFDDAFSELEKEIYNEYSSDARKKEQSEFEQWKAQQEKEYADYKRAYFEALNEYKKTILKYWKQAEVTDKKNWVAYSEDLQTKRIVDFEHNEIRISLLNVKAEAADEEIEAIVDDQLKQILKQTPNSAKKNDPVLNAIGNTKDESDKQSNMSVLSELFDEEEQAVDSMAAKLSKQVVIKRPSKQQRIEKKQPVVVTIKLPNSSIGRRAAKYKQLVEKNATKNKLDAALVLAIMHTESAFNPLARSHIPAYGLMQIVPESAGRDVSQRLYGKDQIFSADYLYNASNNIQAGATYMNILYYSYLKGVNNPVSRMYCVIAAYNTGAGNVAKAFSGNRNLRKALPTINNMSPDQVYNTLINNLPYQETRNYLKHVLKRKKIYTQI